MPSRRSIADLRSVDGLRLPGPSHAKHAGLSHPGPSREGARGKGMESYDLVARLWKVKSQKQAATRAAIAEHTHHHIKEQKRQDK